jgi:thioredoxin
MIFVYILLGIVALLYGFQKLMMMKMRKMKGKPVPELEGKMGKMVSSQEKGLFYFYSPSCAPCAAVTPVITDMAENNENIFKVDISQDFNTARKFGVLATPTIVLVDEGIVTDLLIGPKPESMIRGLMS